MGNAVIEFLFVWIRLGIRFANTFGNHLWIALLMASVFAIFALHASRVFQEVAAKGAAHDVVELLKHEFVSVKLVDLLLALADGSFTVQPNIEGLLVLVLFCEAYRKLNSTHRL